MTKTKELIVVLGMHRSGTSVITRGLQVLAVDLGDTLIPPAIDNPKGFWEDQDILRINEALLVELQSAYDSVGLLELDMTHPSPVIAELEKDAQSALAKKFSRVNVFAIKDPRLARLLPFWQRVFSNSRASVAYVIALRNPLSVVDSLAIRDGFDPVKSSQLWHEHMLTAVNYTKGKRRVIVDYDKVLADPESAFRRIAKQINIGVIHPDELKKYQKSFLDRSLRHTHYTRKDVLESTYLSLGIRKIYPILADCAEDLRGIDDHELTAMVTQQMESLRGNYPVLKIINHLDDPIKYQNQLLIDWFKEQISLLQEQNSELVTSLLAQTRETDWFKEQFFLIQHSRSWRWTKPLRALANVARHSTRKNGTPLIAPTSDDKTSQSRAPLVQLSPPQKTRPRPMALPKNVVPATTGLRILIVTPDIVGPIRNGGIGTAFTALALFAARAGSRVSILYTLGSHSEHWSITDCVDWYAHGGVSFIPLRSAGDAPNIDAPWPRRNAYGVYTWLKAHGENYDLIIFPEWHGDAYYAAVGRHQGLMLQHAQIWVNTHGPSVWSMEGNYQLPTEVDLIDLDFMERETVRLADGVVSPSAYLLNWMRDHQWQLPKQALIIQNLMEEESVINEAAHPDINAINELIFFGRLEPRKGLIIFCDAVDRLIPTVRDQLQMITFMGKALPTDVFDSISYIEKRSVAWGVPITIQTEYGRDQALAYLSESPSRLAIIASLVENLPYTVLECLHHGIRFIATEIGGIPELVDHADHTRVLFPPRPSALARLLENAITEGIAPAHRAQMPEQVEAQWQVFLAQIAESLKEKPAAPAIPLEQVPLVSICMPHHNSHDTLHSALDSIRQQTYSHYEVIVVDDGSSDKKSLDALMALEKEFAEKGWMLIHQENAYPGAARNRAVEAAKGEYLLFMDDDNLAMPHELETFVAVAKHTGADILTTVSAVFTDNMPPKHPKHLWLPLGAATGAGVYRNAFGDMNSFWKKTAFHTVGGFTEDYGLGHEDWEILAKATLMGLHLELVPEPLFWYRATANGVQTSGDMAAYLARSARPYLQHDPHGLGMMAAYAAWARFSAASVVTNQRLRKRTPWRTLFSFARRQDLIIKFRITIKRYGIKIAILKTMQYMRSHTE